MAVSSPYLSEETGSGGLPFVRVQNAAGMAKICLLGATVTEFQPAGAQPLLWLSPNSRFEAGVPIRGGIPVCWPWFGAHTTPGMPMHGFVRTQLWQLDKVEDLGPACTAVELALADSPATLAVWPYKFEARLRVTVGSALELALTGTNRDQQAMPISGALHTYFKVGDIAGIRIDGLDGAPFLSKVHNFQEFSLPGPIQIGERIDRVYTNTTAACTLHDPSLGRKLRIEKGGSRTTVVWNPWEQVASEMADLGAGTFREFVCVESVVGTQEQLVLPPGQSHTLSQKFWII